MASAYLPGECRYSSTVAWHSTSTLISWIILTLNINRCIHDSMFMYTVHIHCYSVGLFRPKDTKPVIPIRFCCPGNTWSFWKWKFLKVENKEEMTLNDWACLPTKSSPLLSLHLASYPGPFGKGFRMGLGTRLPPSLLPSLPPLWVNQLQNLHSSKYIYRLWTGRKYASSCEHHWHDQCAYWTSMV